MAKYVVAMRRVPSMLERGVQIFYGCLE